MAVFRQFKTPPQMKLLNGKRNYHMGGKRIGSGRKAIKIDLGLLEKLCTMHCTDVELAGIFEVNVRTIERHKKKPAFAAVMERGRAKGRPLGSAQPV
jgi:hypothetical protein